MLTSELDAVHKCNATETLKKCYKAKLDNG